MMSAPSARAAATPTATRGARAGLPLYLGAHRKTDARATRDAHAVAFTRGRDVVLSPAAPSPDTVAGRRLLGHELTHVHQQSRAARVDPHAADVAHPALEREAERAGDLAARGVSPSTAAERALSGSYGTVPALQRQPTDRHTAPEVESSDAVLHAGLVPPPFLARAEGHLALDGFANDSAALAGDHRGRLAAHAATLRRLLRAYPDGTVTVTGHTDAVGSEASNLLLGQRRADAVRDALIEDGVPDAAVGTLSAGESTPAVAGRGPDSRNRRAVIRFEPQSWRSIFGAMILGTPTATASPGAPTAKPLPPALLPSFDNLGQERPEQLSPRVFAPLPPAPARTGRSITKMASDALDGSIDGALRKLSIPAWARARIIDGAHAAIEKGAETALDNALDSANVHGAEREAIKAAVKAAAQTPVR